MHETRKTSSALSNVVSSSWGTQVVCCCCCCCFAACTECIEPCMSAQVDKWAAHSMHETAPKKMGNGEHIYKHIREAIHHTLRMADDEEFCEYPHRLCFFQLKELYSCILAACEREVVIQIHVYFNMRSASSKRQCLFSIKVFFSPVMLTWEGR